MVITDFTRSLTGKLHRGVEKPPEGKSPPKSTTIPLVLGILTQEVYSREYRMLSGIKAGLLTFNSGLIEIMQEDLEAKDLSQIQQCFSESVTKAIDEKQANAVTVATPCLEPLGSLIAREQSMEFLSLNQEIACSCEKHQLRNVGLLGTSWDTSQNSHLVTMLKQHGIGVSIPSDTAVRNLLTHCVRYEVRGGIYYNGKSCDSEAFCLSAVEDMVERDQIDGLILCNGELRYLAKDIGQKWPQLKIINAMLVHWQLLQKSYEEVES